MNFTPPYTARIMLRLRSSATDEPTELVRFTRMMSAHDWSHWTRDLSDCWEVWVEKPMDAKHRLETFLKREASKQMRLTREEHDKLEDRGLTPEYKTQ